jgi:hypothetical protein
MMGKTGFEHVAKTLILVGERGRKALPPISPHWLLANPLSTPAVVAAAVCLTLIPAVGQGL